MQELQKIKSQTKLQPLDGYILHRCFQKCLKHIIYLDDGNNISSISILERA